MERKDWVIDIIKEYITKNQIKTTIEKINELHDYFISEGYDESIGIVLASLYADSKVKEILYK